MYFWDVTGSVVGKGDDGKKLFYYELKIILYYELPHSKEEWESQFLLVKRKPNFIFHSELDNMLKP